MAAILLNATKAKVFTPPAEDEEVKIPACVVVHSYKGQGPIIDSLKTRIRGPATKNAVSQWFSSITRHHLSFVQYFLVGLRGVGKTSKAFRAVTNTGHECVVKMYVLEYDGARRIHDFDVKGREAMSKEKAMYDEIYPELSGNVWTERLCPRHCLILPFFEEIPKSGRGSYVEKVGHLYEEQFQKKNYRIAKDNVHWRHVGTFGGKCYLFGFGDLQSDEGVDRKELERTLNGRKASAASSEEDV